MRKVGSQKSEIKKTKKTVKAKATKRAKAKAAGVLGKKAARATGRKRIAAKPTAMTTPQASRKVAPKRPAAPKPAAVKKTTVPRLLEPARSTSNAEHLVLVLNPGSTSTKVAVFRGGKPLCQESIEHERAELEKYPRIVDQHPMRQQVVMDFLARHKVDIKSLGAVVDRGGLLKPISSGTYRINEAMLQDLREAKRGEHISNVGAFIAKDIAGAAGCPAFIVDAVSVDEFTPLARISGLAGIERKSLLHALNMRMAALQACQELGKRLDQVNLIVAHLGGGISISPVDKGKFVDVNNANEHGPFSPERAGHVPCADLVKMCFSGKYTKEDIVKKLTRNGGLAAYLDTNKAGEAVERAKNGDRQAAEVLEAMCYQIAKEIGACATVLRGRVDAIVVTGGVAYNRMLTDWIRERTEFISKKFLVYPGEDEMPALAAGALRVLLGQEKAREY
jgi:butyrate kinase